MAPRTISTAELQARTLKRGERVRLVNDLPSLGAGAEGKVAMANGFTWKRYWVRFGDGQVLGHIDHDSLVRSKDYDRYLAAREREATQVEATVADIDDSEGEAADAAAAGGGEAVVNGVPIPAYLLERSASARARLGA